MPFLIFLFLFFSTFTLSHAESAITNVNGKWTKDAYVPLGSVQEHYDLGYRLICEGNYKEAQRNFAIISYHFADTAFYSDALFYEAVCHYFLGDFHSANLNFSRYLNLSGNLKHFEKVFEFKYHIAELYRTGCKKPILGIRKMPRLAPAKEEALKLYDELIVSLPNRELGAKALFGKAQLLKGKRDYKESIDTLHTLTRRFPKHTLAAESYLLIAKIYLEQSRIESQNPDLLALAQVNFQRFLKSFPGDDRVKEVEGSLLAIKEVFAQSLFDTGRFYERKKKPSASTIYYADSIRRYPETIAAQKSRDRLRSIDPSLFESLAQNEKIFIK